MRAGAFHGACHGPRLPEVSQLPQMPCNAGTTNARLYSFRKLSSSVAAGRRAGLVSPPGPRVQGNTPSTPRAPQHNPGKNGVSGNSTPGNNKPGNSKPAKAGVALGKGGQQAVSVSGQDSGGDEVNKLNAKKLLDKVEARVAQSVRLWCRALDYGSFMDCFANLIMVATQESSYRDCTPSARAQLDEQLRAIMHTLAYHYLPLVPGIGKVKHGLIPLEACAVLPYGWAGSGAGAGSHGEVPLGETLLRRLAANNAAILQSPQNHVALWEVLARMPREVLWRQAAALNTFSYAALLVQGEWDAKCSAEVLQLCAECRHAHAPLLHHLTGVVARGKPDQQNVVSVLNSLSQLRVTCRHVPDRRQLRALGRMAAECLHQEHYRAVFEAPAAVAAGAKEGSRKQDAGDGSSSSGKKEAGSGDSGSSKKDEGPVTHGPIVLMSGDNIELVMQTLGLGLGTSADVAAGDVGGLAATTAGGSSGAAAGGGAGGFAPSNGFLHNLRALVVSDLMRKGFTAHHSEAAWDDTHAAAQQAGDYGVSFMASRKLRVEALLQRLLLTLPDSELPAAYRTHLNFGSSASTSSMSTTSTTDATAAAPTGPDAPGTPPALPAPAAAGEVQAAVAPLAHSQPQPARAGGIAWDAGGAAAAVPSPISSLPLPQFELQGQQGQQQEEQGQEQQQEEQYAQPSARPALSPQEMLERRVARLQRSAERDAIRNGPWRQGRLERALARWRYSWNPETAALRAQRERLPAWSLQEAVVDAVENNQVVVISGETGCGKTTQVPQFLLDAAIDAGVGGTVGLVCTQPRRISATSVAQRIAAERCEPIGRTVGYSVRMESCRSRDTRLLLCTTGVLLRRLIDDPLLAGTTHIIIDEVHERSLDSDFLLVLLKALLPRRPDLRLVLMSATVNEKKFSSYFGGCPVLNIPGRTHPVKEYYLEDVLQMTSFTPDSSADYIRKPPAAPARGNPSPKLKAALAAWETEQAAIAALGNKGYPDPVLSALRQLDPDKINYELAVAAVEWVVGHGEEGAILIFMPGLMEISRMQEALLASPSVRQATQGGAYVIPLHSALAAASSDQKAVFSRPPEGVRKIVIATNIAETSITIDDVVWVVDSGRVKENRYSPETHMQALVECWASRASVRQRRGRAGRVSPGHCLRLFSRHTHDVVMDAHQQPEILRVPLEGLVLQIKLLGVAGGGSEKEVAAFLGQALEPPERKAVAAAVQALVNIGALQPGSLAMTPLGAHLAELPVDVRVGKMLIYASILGCLTPVAIIAAAMSSRSPFLSPLEFRDQADEVKVREFGGAKSDALAVLAAYRGWEASKAGRGWGAHRSYCSDMFLSWRSLETMKEMVEEFRRLLREAGFIARGRRGGLQAAGAAAAAGGGEGWESWQEGPDRSRGGGWVDPCDAHADNLMLVRAVLVAGLYPNVVRVEHRSAKVVFKGAKGSGKESSTTRPKSPKLVAQVQLPDGRAKERRVLIHPSSVNYDVKRYESPWLVYGEAVESNNAIYLRDSTMVTPYPLLLFGGPISVQLEGVAAAGAGGAGGCVCVGDWARLPCAPKVGVLFKELRAQLDAVLQEKIERPDTDVWERGGPVISTILQLLTTEELGPVPEPPAAAPKQNEKRPQGSGREAKSGLKAEGGTEAEVEGMNDTDADTDVEVEAAEETGAKAGKGARGRGVVRPGRGMGRGKGTGADARSGVRVASKAGAAKKARAGAGRAQASAGAGTGESAQPEAEAEAEERGNGSTGRGGYRREGAGFKAAAEATVGRRAGFLVGVGAKAQAVSGKGSKHKGAVRIGASRERRE